jgi:hypothetical protein
MLSLSRPATTALSKICLRIEFFSSSVRFLSIEVCSIIADFMAEKKGYHLLEGSGLIQSAAQ